jgi:hypothetical protein
VAPEPFLAGLWAQEPRDTWWHQSPHQPGGEARSLWIRGSAEAHLSSGAGSGAVGHVAAPKPISVGRQGLELYNMWQCVDAQSAPCLVLKPVSGGNRSVGYQQPFHRSPGLATAAVGATLGKVSPVFLFGLGLIGPTVPFIFFQDLYGIKFRGIGISEIHKNLNKFDKISKPIMKLDFKLNL